MNCAHALFLAHLLRAVSHIGTGWLPTRSRHSSAKPAGLPRTNIRNILFLSGFALCWSGYRLPLLDAIPFATNYGHQGDY
jgi:hypothetical protein